MPSTNILAFGSGAPSPPPPPPTPHTHKPAPMPFEGCSSGSCFDCCVKSGDPCEAHARQLEKKQREDVLLAAMPSAGVVGGGGAGGEGGVAGGVKGRRLPTGAFKEVSLHCEWVGGAGGGDANAPGGDDGACTPFVWRCICCRHVLLSGLTCVC